MGEAELIAEARSLLGDDEEVLAAGHFGLASLIVGQAAGMQAGSLLSGGDALAGGMGGLAATKAAAEAQGVTMKVIVAITPDTVHLLNRDTGGRLEARVTSFDRATVEVSVQKMGLSRYLSLRDPGDGHSIDLHGSVSWLSAQAAGDKIVLDLLAG